MFQGHAVDWCCRPTHGSALSFLQLLKNKLLMVGTQQTNRSVECLWSLIGIPKLQFDWHPSACVLHHFQLEQWSAVKSIIMDSPKSQICLTGIYNLCSIQDPLSVELRLLISYLLTPETIQWQLLFSSRFTLLVYINWDTESLRWKPF